MGTGPDPPQFLQGSITIDPPILAQTWNQTWILYPPKVFGPGLSIAQWGDISQLY